MLKNLPAMQETWVHSLGEKDPLEKGRSTHSSILVWRIPWREEPSQLQSSGVCKESDRTEQLKLSLLHFSLCICLQQFGSEGESPPPPHLAPPPQTCFSWQNGLITRGLPRGIKRRIFPPQRAAWVTKMSELFSEMRLISSGSTLWTHLEGSLNCRLLCFWPSGSAVGTWNLPSSLVPRELWCWHFEKFWPAGVFHAQWSRQVEGKSWTYLTQKRRWGKYPEKKQGVRGPDRGQWGTHLREESSGC